METREPYDVEVCKWYQVELLDSKGQSKGYIGYRFNAPGAEAAANGWNNDRDRGDLIAVIKPFEAAKPAEKPYEAPTAPDHPQIIAARRDYLALEQIADVFEIGSEARKDRYLIVENARNLVDAIKNPLATPGVSMFAIEPAKGRELAEKLKQLSNSDRHARIVLMDDPTSQLRGHNRMLTRALGACMRSMANGSPSEHYRARWLRARQLAEDVMAEIARHTPFTG